MRGRPRMGLLGALLVVLLVGASACTPATSSDGAEEASPTWAVEAISTAHDPDQLVVCISGMVTPSQGLAYYQGLSEYVAGAAGKKLRLIHKASYGELNELLESGQVDMAFSCSGPYVAGHDDYGLELLAAPVVNGAKTYRAYIIVPAQSTADSLHALGGSTFAFTDPDSNTGCMVPTYMLAVKGTTPDEFFGRVIYTYSHDNSISAVAKGEVAGASVDSLIWEYANATDPTYTAQTKVIATSEPYGIPPVVVRPDLDPILKKALQTALLEADEDPAGRVLLANMHIERFDTIDDSAYSSVREMSSWIEAQKAK